MDGDYVARLLMGSAGLDFGLPGLDSGFFDTLCGGGAGAGFGERAAGMPGSGFGGGGPFGVPEGNCGGGDLGAASREGSSVSDPAWAYGANAKKRKAPAGGKGKEAAACFAKVGEATVLDSKKCKIEEEMTVRPKVENETAGASDGSAGGERARKQAKGKSSKSKPADDEPPRDYVHVRARRGQATDSHSLAERVRREKITLKMKFLQDLVPGCNKVIGKALMLDEIINYVQSLQQQVEFLSMKLSTVNPELDFSTLSTLLHKDMHQALGPPSASSSFPLESSGGVFPFSDQADLFQSFSSGPMGSMGLLDMALPQAANTPYAFQKQPQGFWEENLQNAPHMSNEQCQENGVSAPNFDGQLQGADHTDVEY